MTSFQKLMLITQYTQNHEAYLRFIYQAAQSGITALQLREKNVPQTQLFEWGQELKIMLAPFKIPLIINDDIELACQLNADGVHLGQTDGDPNQARRLLGPHKMIGLSVESLQEVARANACKSLSYIAASAVFASRNKDNLKTHWGIKGLKEVVKQSRHPVIGIGGINHHNVSQVMQTGVAGVAVIGCIHDDPNTAQSVQSLRRLIDIYP
jgi:thiamine-phosphate pyrophosphorylase